MNTARISRALRDLADAIEATDDDSRPSPLQPTGQEIAEFISGMKCIMASRVETGVRGRVYFIGPIDGPIKIGTSLSPERRLEALRTASPLPLVLIATMAGGLREESLLHSRFAKHRLHSEWFEPAPELLEFIESLRATS